MNLQRLRPKDGWRQFAGEVGVIVLGVLIALGAQQIADGYQWRREVRQTEQALADEIAKSVVDAAERHMVDRCLRDRLNHLIDKVSSGDARWVGDPMLLQQAQLGVKVVPVAYRTPGRDWSDHVWQAAKSSGVFNHMRRDRVSAYSNIYAIIDGQRVANRLEEQTFPRLLYLSFDTQLDAEARRQALGVLGQLDWLNGAQVNETRKLINTVRAMKLDFSRTNLRSDLKQKEDTQRAFRGKCVQHVDIMF